MDCTSHLFRVADCTGLLGADVEDAAAARRFLHEARDCFSWAPWGGSPECPTPRSRQTIVVNRSSIALPKTDSA